MSVSSASADNENVFIAHAVVLTSPEYSITISPASKSLKQNNPLRCILDLYTPTEYLLVSFNCRNRIAIGKLFTEPLLKFT